MIDSPYQTLTFERESQQTWKGLASEKFSFYERKHFPPRDMLKRLEAVDLPPLGRKYISPKYVSPKPIRSSIRTFPVNQNCRSQGEELKIYTKQEFIPTEKPYGHKEKRHLQQDGSLEWIYSPSIKTFHHMMDQKKIEYTVEKIMGKKRLLETLDEQRNLLDVRSLGDKFYKNPEYSPNFFKDGGLMTGSTHKSRKAKEYISTLVMDKSNKPKGTTWKDRLIREERDEEEKVVKELFEWEQTNLKDGNPKWRDPDLVEPETPRKNGDPKNVKTTGAKK